MDTSPVAFDYLHDRNPFSCIIGPVGSGKSVASLLRILPIAHEQRASSDGVRRTRGAIIRNTMPQLRSTTMQTYENIYPGHRFGQIIMRSPAEHTIAPRGSDIQAQCLFIALDKPQDIKRLLSLELTWAFLNEIREIPRAVLNRMTERVGRYRLEERATTWSGVWGDTNPPDADHWLYGVDQGNRPAGWSFYHQPPGVLEVRETGDGVVVEDESFPGMSGMKLRTGTVRCYYEEDRGRYRDIEFPIEVMHAVDRAWIVNPFAENLSALMRANEGANPLGPHGYYGRALAGKTLEEIRSYLQGVYTFVSDGRRVVPNYHPETHSREHITPIDGAEIFINCDIGGGTLQPSAIFMQRHPRGPIMCLSEIVCTDGSGMGQMGVKRFGETIMQHIAERYAKHHEAGLIRRGWGDPAGVGRDEIFEVAAFDYLRSEFGIRLQPAPTQDPAFRVQALLGPCGRLYDQVPGLLVSRTGCPMLHKGLSGQWYYKRVRDSGEERYSDKPVKNDHSHPCDAAGYGCLGMGEFALLSAVKSKSYTTTVPGRSGQPGNNPFSHWPKL